MECSSYQVLYTMMFLHSSVEPGTWVDTLKGGCLSDTTNVHSILILTLPIHQPVHRRMAREKLEYRRILFPILRETQLKGETTRALC